MAVACLCGGFFLLFFRRLIQIVRHAGVRQAESLNSMTSVFTDGLAGAKPLKVMGVEKHFVSFVRTQSERYKQAARQYVMGVGALTSAQEPVLAILLAAGLYWGRSLLNIDGMTLVTLAFFFQRAISRFSGAQQSYQQFVGVEGILGSLRGKITSLRSQREPGGLGRRVTLKREVRLKGVDFAYRDKTVLEGLDLTISVGSITALHGPSGAGKTTVADLVAGLVVPKSGYVSVDNIPLAELDLHHWRSQIGYVPQEVFLFNDTIRNNVALGRDISDERVWTVLDQAGAKNFVEATGCGLDYLAGEQGRALSGGQRQRLMIARALAGSPRLLILDEATTGLDEATEREIWSRIALLKGSMAVLVVSHQKIVQEIADSMVRIELDLGPQAKPPKHNDLEH
jgi:ATP-binding cassette subfamily C protein